MPHPEVKVHEERVQTMITAASVLMCMYQMQSGSKRSCCFYLQKINKNKFKIEETVGMAVEKKTKQEYIVVMETYYKETSNTTSHS